MFPEHRVGYKKNLPTVED